MPEIHELGRYRIESYLGSGAHADVYKAVDTLLDRIVALKVLKPALLADEQAFGRFLQEAKSAADLVHPHIAWVWDLGQADGRYYIAMRFIDGISLAQMLKQKGALDWDAALLITGQVAEALEFAHQKGLVHRDVKPQNILISEKDGAVLSDFGLVKAMQAGGLSTVSGAILGTPQYIPPEVWMGEPVGPAGDQYALACVFVEMLTGKALFNAPTPPAVMKRHFDPPSLPADWSETQRSCLEKALSPAADQRYQSVSQFYRALVSEDDYPQPPTHIENLAEKSVLPLSIIENDKPRRNPSLPQWLFGIAFAAIVLFGIIMGLAFSGAMKKGAATPTASAKAVIVVSETFTQISTVVDTPSSVPAASDTPTLKPFSTNTPRSQTSPTPSNEPTIIPALIVTATQWEVPVPTFGWIITATSTRQEIDRGPQEPKPFPDPGGGG